MRTTLRTLTWECGCLVLLLSAVPLVLLNWFWPLAGLVPSAVWTLYMLYCQWVTYRYPCRGDLPEWQKHLTAREEEHRANHCP